MCQMLFIVAFYWLCTHVKDLKPLSCVLVKHVCTVRPVGRLHLFLLVIITAAILYLLHNLFLHYLLLLQNQNLNSLQLPCSNYSSNIYFVMILFGDTPNCCCDVFTFTTLVVSHNYSYWHLVSKLRVASVTYMRILWQRFNRCIVG